MSLTVIEEKEAQFFHENGYLIVRSVVQGEELRRLRAATDALVAQGVAGMPDNPDFAYGVGHKTGLQVLKRVEYVIDKRDECKVLLGNPFILRSVERLMGNDLIPTWDSMVLKQPGEGIIVPWHRDSGTGCVGDKPIFNVDFYLDAAEEENCVWVIPGSHLWSDERVKAWLADRAGADKTREEFRATGAVPALMQPGDVLFHNILVLHGSPASSAEHLRRVIYYEFRPAHVEEALGPHVPAYIPLKQKLLLACLAKRKAADYIPDGEAPYVTRPPAPYDMVHFAPDETLPTYRYAHGDYWRPTTWTPEGALTVKGVGAGRVSPDGERVVYTVTEAVLGDEKSEYVTCIHHTRLDTKETISLTFEGEANNPQWSPDGKTIAFTAKRGEKTNLFLLRAEGGEAEKLTDMKGDVGAFAWSPDSKHIAFLMADPPDEAEEKRNKDKEDARWVEEEWKMVRLYLVPIAKDLAGKREPRKLTPGATSVGGLSGTEFDWSSDGTQIVFAHLQTPKANAWPTADVSRVEIATGEITPVAASPAAEGQPRFSPDGKWIAMTVSDNPPRWAFSSAIHLFPTDGGTPRALPTTYDSNPNLIGWSADSRQLYYAEAYGTASALCAVHIETEKTTILHRGDGYLSDIHLSPRRDHFGLALQRTDAPVEAFVTHVDHFAPVPVSQANAKLPALPLGKTEKIRWPSADGQEIEGLLTYPANYTAGKRVPLLLVIHGGPAGVFMENFTGMPSLYPVASFAAKGYAVLRANPRGSSGYGKPFRYANQKDWGRGDYQDLMTGVDHVIAMGVGDPDRLGVMGWSYGGYMTSWIITQTHRFKAASVGAAVTNLVSFTGTADIPDFLPSYFGAQFWDDEALYRAHSPLFQVKGVQTPTLIQHGDADERVPISQGYELYNALKTQGVPTRMLVLPRQPHGPREPKMMLKVMQSNIAWFDKYV